METFALSGGNGNRAHRKRNRCRDPVVSRPAFWSETARPGLTSGTHDCSRCARRGYVGGVIASPFWVHIGMTL